MFPSHEHMNADRRRTITLWSCALATMAALFAPTVITSNELERTERTKVGMRSLSNAYLAPPSSKILVRFDGWGRPLRYVFSRDREHYAIASAGRDGEFAAATERLLQLPERDDQKAANEATRLLSQLCNEPYSFDDDFVLADGNFVLLPCGFSPTKFEMAPSRARAIALALAALFAALWLVAFRRIRRAMAIACILGGVLAAGSIYVLVLHVNRSEHIAGMDRDTAELRQRFETVERMRKSLTGHSRELPARQQTRSRTIDEARNGRLTAALEVVRQPWIFASLRASLEKTDSDLASIASHARELGVRLGLGTNVERHSVVVVKLHGRAEDIESFLQQWPFSNPTTIRMTRSGIWYDAHLETALPPPRL